MGFDAETLAQLMVDKLPEAWNQIKGANTFPGWVQDGDVDSKKDTLVVFLAITKALFAHLASADSLTISDAHNNSITLDANGIKVVSHGNLAISDAHQNSVTLDANGAAIANGAQSIVVSPTSVSVNDGALEVT